MTYNFDGEGQLADDHFPHRDGESGRPLYRRHQRETILEILKAISDSSVDDIIVEAPTGAGKTSVAVTVARILTHNFKSVHNRLTTIYNRPLTKKDESAIEELSHHQVHMLTSMKMLQDAYLGDDKSIVLVKGKNNYVCRRDCHQLRMCGDGGALTCENSQHMFGRHCRDCSYTSVLEKAIFSPVALHNFDSFLYQASLGGIFGPRRLLTMDEAHNAEEKLRSFTALNLNNRLLASFHLPWDPPDVRDLDGVAEWVLWIKTGLMELGKDTKKNLDDLRAKNRDEDRQVIMQLSRRMKRVEELYSRISRFTGNELRDKSGNARWVADMESDQKSISIKAVCPGSIFSQYALKSFGKQRLYLSATFLGGNNHNSYIRSMNLDPTRTYTINVPSTFPAHNRPIITRSAGDLGQRDWGKNFGSLVKTLREVFEENKGVRGVVHCTSYGMSEQLAGALSDSDRLLVYDRFSRDEIVKSFVSGRVDDDAILLAVALNEGYDFKDDLCRFQVIVRIPYPVPTSCVKARKALDGEFYTWHTCLTLTQAYGRGMRSADDWCRTYIVDGRFSKFVRRGDVRRHLPNWFLEAVQ